MGYSIYYDRAFIRVGDKYIPLVNSGASNTAEYVGSRLVPERNWDVLNWKRRDRVLFSESEIHDIAKEYERNHQENGMSFKSRSKPFAPGEFERWIVGGMKRAYTIEEYIYNKNRLNVVDYPDGMTNRWRRQPFSTEEELLNIIKQFEPGHEFHIAFDNNRQVYLYPALKTQNHNNKGRATNHLPLSSEKKSEGKKSSVLERLAESRNEVKPISRINPAPGRKKSNDPEL